MKYIGKKINQVTRAEYVVDLFRDLKKENIPLRTVSNMCNKMCNDVKPEQTKKLIQTIMQYKKQSAYRSLHQSKREYTNVITNNKQTLYNHHVHADATKLFREEKHRQRQLYKQKRINKVIHLRKIHFKQKQHNRELHTYEDTIQGIIVGDQQIPSNYNTKVLKYGNVNINKDEETALQLPPKMCVYQNVTKLDLEIEIEKSMCKFRYTDGDYEQYGECDFLNNNSTADNTQTIEPPLNPEITSQNTTASSSTIEEQNVEEDRQWPIDNINKVINMSFLRPTDIPNKHITLPRPLKAKKELKLQQVKQELLEASSKYVNETNKNNKINKTDNYDTNLSKTEVKGIKSLQKNKDVITFTTDKTGMFTADTIDNYKEASEIHTNNDTIITEAEHLKAQKTINAHSTLWTRITKAGTNTKSESDASRIRTNLTVDNSGYAPQYALRKDHKPSEDQTKGPPTRPVCGASAAYNRKLAHFISMILRPIWQQEETVCTNTEEVMAAFNDVNTKDITNTLTVGSADVKALYPSLDINHTAEIVANEFYESEYTIEDIDTNELSLYLVLNMSAQDITNNNLDNYCHKRKTNRGAPPTITGCATDNTPEKRFKPWIPPTQTPDKNTTKKMLSLALQVVIKLIMNNHIYKINDTYKKQSQGGPIGLELTGDIAQIYMCWWDKQMKTKLTNNSIQTLVYLRYVDDINFIIETKDNQQTTTNQINPIDEFKRLGNTIHPSIQIVTDTPTNYKENKMPILDLKVWTERRKKEDGSTTSKILHEFYHKEIASKAITHANSATSMQSKRNILTAEVLRVMLRCSPLLEWSITAAHVSEMMKRMQHAGYGRRFRAEITKSALNKYADIINKDKTNECPMYRNKEWKKTERETKKREGKTNWYKKGDSSTKSVLFVPATPNSELQRSFKNIINKHQIEIKVVEKAGQQIKQLLQTSDPFKTPKCPDITCFVCSTHNTNKPSNCRKDGIIYNIICDKCGSKYVGESARNANTRGKEHLNEFKYKQESSIMLRHIKQCHENSNNDVTFTMKVTHIYGDNCFERQISEGIQINNTPAMLRINNKSEWTHKRIPRPTLTWD